ncbi:hypothetical protein FRC12_003160 [Ceratobasidium sp. 428]|nr:hypothetical protein FRC12_003160 [Ceratobasidium sp. 428]
MGVHILLLIWPISWVILLSVDSAGLNNKSGSDRFTFGNIPRDRQVRYVAAYRVLAWSLMFRIMLGMKKEIRNFAAAHHCHLVDPAHSGSA